LGHASYICSMFIRRNKNRSGSISIQIVKKIKRSNKVLKTVGVAKSRREEELLILLAKTEIERLEGTQSLFAEHDDLVIDNFVDSIANDHFQIVGSELILGEVYKKIGFPDDGCSNYFRNLVLCRIVYPGSKLKTVDYFKRHLNLDISVYSIYRFLDDLESGLKQRIEEITFKHTKKVLRGKVGVGFYDMTA